MGEKRRVSSEFADYLKALRMSKGLSYGELAAKTGISASYLNRLEKRERTSPTFAILQTLAKFYKVEVLQMCKMAMDDSCFDDECGLISLEALLYGNEFTVAGVYATKAIKDSLIELGKCLVDIEWTEKTKYEDIARVLEVADQFKQSLLA